jgi:hypothetical protein
LSVLVSLEIQTFLWYQKISLFPLWSFSLVLDSVRAAEPNQSLASHITVFFMLLLAIMSQHYRICSGVFSMARTASAAREAGRRNTCETRSYCTTVEEQRRGDGGNVSFCCIRNVSTVKWVMQSDMILLFTQEHKAFARVLACPRRKTAAGW